MGMFLGLSNNVKPHEVAKGSCQTLGDWTGYRGQRASVKPTYGEDAETRSGDEGLRDTRKFVNRHWSHGRRESLPSRYVKDYAPRDPAENSGIGRGEKFLAMHEEDVGR
jgi:hypothetical protein